MNVSRTGTMTLVCLVDAILADVCAMLARASTAIGIEYIEMVDAAHFVMLDQPGMFCEALLAFLRD